MKIPPILLPHAIMVSTYLGEGSEGPVYAVPVMVRANVQGSLTVNGDGQRVGSLMIYAQADRATILGLQSTVSWQGHDLTVRAVAVRTDGGLGAWEHVEVSAA